MLHLSAIAKEPFSRTSGGAALHGSLCPDTGVTKPGAMSAAFHVAARSVARHTNNISGHYQNVMSWRTAGVTMMSTASGPEVRQI